VAEEPWVAGLDGPGVDARVGVAEERGFEAQTAGDEGDVVVAGVERGPVEHRPVVHQVHAGVQGGSARPAGRGLGEMAPESDTAGGEPVEVRRVRHGVRGRAQAVAAPLVGGDEQDVCVRCHGNADRGNRESPSTVTPGTMSDTKTQLLPLLPLTQGVVLPQMVVTIALETDEAKRAAEAAAVSGNQIVL